MPPALRAGCVSQLGDAVPSFSWRNPPHFSFAPSLQAYHFGHPSIDAVAQANYFINAVNAGKLHPGFGRRLFALATVARP